MSPALHSHSQITVEVLSPVHIGDGSQLTGDVDYVVHRGRTWVVNHEVLLDQVLGDSDDFRDDLLGRPIDELLQPADFEHGEVFQYVMRGEPVNRYISSHIKDVYGRPYLPGSSLKGLLRTLFVWGLYAAQNQTPDLNRLGRSRSWASQGIERDLMGATPNEDLFRAVHVADSEPVELDRLSVTPVSIYPTGSRGSQGVVVDVEALRRGTQFTSRMSIEEYGFTDAEALRRLGWDNKRPWLDRIAQFGRVFAGRRLAQEIEYYRIRQNSQAMLSFYSQLVKLHEQLEKGQFLAQIGWGTGWNSKTLNDLLLEDKQVFAGLVRDYRLTRFHRDFTPDKQFPSSRHLTEQNMPIGWVRVTIE